MTTFEDVYGAMTAGAAAIRGVIERLEIEQAQRIADLEAELRTARAENEELRARIDALEQAEPVEPGAMLEVRERLNFRTAPEISRTNVIRLLEPGETLTRLREARGQAVLDQGDVWYEVLDSAGVRGWVHSAYVEVVAGSSPDGVRFDPPVGSDAERRGPQVWPGTWFDATGFATYYTAVGPAYHTGADLNNNSPAWDSDRLAPVYAAADGEVTHAGPLPGTWGNVIVIEHGQQLHTRYAHLADISVQVGQRVARGQQIARVGNAGGQVPYHLHFDISTSGILATNPGHWPGNNRAAVLEHYVDPREWIIAHRPGSDHEAILPLNEGWIGLDGPGDTGDPGNPQEMEGWPYLVDDTVFRRIDASNVPALRLHFPGTPSAVVERLKALPAEEGKPERQIQFLCGRVRYAFPADRAVEPAEHVEAVAPFVQRGIDAGVDWWSPLNEPNVPPELAPEGFGGSWVTGTGCGLWFVEWARLFHARWPDSHVLLPAVSPGIAGHGQFFDQMVAAGALAAADGFEIHSYWTDAESLTAEIERTVALARRHFTKPCFVTECANVAGAPGRDRAVQFVHYWQEVTRRTDNIEGVFWFNVFTTHPAHRVSEVDMEMAEALGQLLREEF